MPVPTVFADVNQRGNDQPTRFQAGQATSSSATDLPPTPAELEIIELVLRGLPPWQTKPRTAEVLHLRLLHDSVEVSLEAESGKATKAVNSANSRASIEKQMADIAKQTETDLDGFVRNLKKSRPDLAGLPWRLGESCRLPLEEAHALLQRSRTFHECLDSSHGDEFKLFLGLSRSGDEDSLKPEAIPALQQILEIESKFFRQALVQHADKFQHPAATAAIARRAIFDLDPEVRLSAIECLRKRDPEQIAPMLVIGFQYPWGPVAQHAAEAVTSLQLTEMLPNLLKLLDQPDPDAPFLQIIDGRQTEVVRELVCINHVQNCLLCHPPASHGDAIVPGPIPLPSRSIGGGHYGKGGSGQITMVQEPGGPSVRAEVTYLKQDFSVMQPVTQLRLDYLVRIRPLNSAEQTALDKKQKTASPQAISEHKQAILYALRSLTGRDAGASVQGWREVVAGMPGR